MCGKIARRDLRGGGQVTGRSTLMLQNKKEPEAEIGYDLSKDYWGKGYMKEAMVPVIKFGFNVMRLSTINAFIHIENIRSNKFIRKLGFLLTEKKDAQYKYILTLVSSKNRYKFY